MLLIVIVEIRDGVYEMVANANLYRWQEALMSKARAFEDEGMTKGINTCS